MSNPTLPDAMTRPFGITPAVGLSAQPMKAAYLAALCVMLVFPAVFVPLRLYVKVFIVRAVRLTDVACLIGFLFYIAFITVAFVAWDVGIGSHAWDLTPSSFARLVQLLNIHEIIYMPNITFVKISILLQLLDIFSPPRMAQNPRWYILWALIILNSVFFSVLLFVTIFQCIPRQKIWHPEVRGSCVDIKKTFVATGVISMADDFIILLLPLVWTWKMQLQTKEKVGVSLIFATALFACVTSVVRLAKSIQSLNSPDISYTFAPVLLWAVAEVSAGLVVGCLPVMPRIFRRRETSARSPQYESSESSYVSRWRAKINVGHNVIQSTLQSIDEPTTNKEQRTNLDTISPHRALGIA